MEFIPEELAILDKSPLSSSYTETFVYTPSEREANLGHLYIAAEVSSNKSKKENAQLVAELANTLKNEYYKNTIVTPLSALRFALKRANILLAAKKNWLTPSTALKLRMGAAALKDRNLHLAKLGEVSALILRGDELQSIIAASNAVTSDTTTSWSFENIVSGELLENDTIVLATNQIHKINESELTYKLQKRDLVRYLKNSGEGIKNLALVVLYPKKTSPLTPIIPMPAPLIAKPNKTYPPSLLWSYGGASRTNRTYLKPIILVLAVAVVAAGVAGVAFKIKREIAGNKKEAETLVQEVTDLKEKIATLIEVKNETEANELLVLTSQKLERLGQLGLFKTTRATLAQELAQISQSLLKLEAVSNVFTVLTLENNSADFEPSELALGKNKIIVFGANTLYKFDLNRKVGGLESLEPGDRIKAVMEKPDDPNIVFVATPDKITAYQTLPQIKTIWARAENQPALAQISLYREAFYLLAEDGLIYKLPYLASSTTPEITVGDLTLWTKSDQTTNYSLLTTNFAVEGSIFGLVDKHTIIELANGQKRGEVTIAETIAKIFTLSNHKNIYALAPAEGVIVAWDKNFNLKRRLTHPELKGARSFVVNSQERVVYFLKGQTVYSFEI
ncbi:MAG: hypothetical protein WAP55_02455 [Minisyncoccia bacterium]